MDQNIINGIKINPHERVDDLHRNGYRIIQDPKRFCFSQDAVLLSAFAKVHKGEKALDLGTGTGIIPILMEAKTDGEFFHGLEIQPESAEMARRSVLLNNLAHKIEITEGDIKNAAALYPPASFDVVTSNPPYMNHGGGLLNAYSPKAIARHELLCTLADVIATAKTLLRPQGRFYMIHRPHRLTDIFVTLREAKLEPKTLRLVHPAENKEPAMVLIESVRGGKPMLKVLPPLIIYDENGKYTDEVYRIYYE
jgi:tRNA1Val (adenine37-N6)-methyltransferase